MLFARFVGLLHVEDDSQYHSKSKEPVISERFLKLKEAPNLGRGFIKK